MTKGLAFLNKKNWHPNTLKNQEKVWLAEREAATEQKRIKEIQRKYEEDRKLQELQEIRDAAGLGPKTAQRLEWMYQHGPSAEEYLLGKPVEIKETVKEDTRTLGLWRRQEITPQQDLWNKLRDDPLLEIEKRKQAQIQHIKENPVKMEKLKLKIKVEVKNEKSPKRRSPSPSRGRSPKKHSHSPVRRSRSPKRRSRSPKRRSRSPSRRSRSPKRRSNSPKRRSRSPKRRSNSPKRRSRSPTRRRRTPPRSDNYRNRSYSGRDDKVDREEEKKKKEEERLKKLEQMRLDGLQHQLEKAEKVKRDEELAKSEEEALAKQAEQPNFMKQMNKSVYGNDKASMEDRLRRNAHYIQRTPAAEGAFMKVK